MANTVSDVTGVSPLKATNKDLDWLKKRLDPAKMVNDVRFNAPIPTMARFSPGMAVPDDYNSFKPQGVSTGPGAYSPGTPGTPRLDAPSVSGPQYNAYVGALGYIIFDRSALDAAFGRRDATSTTTSQNAIQGSAGFSTNWGFRFHFNPPAFSESFTLPGTDINYDKMVKTLIQDGFQGIPNLAGTAITFNLALSRIHDMRVLPKDNYADYYSGTVDEETRQDILKRGTMHDIEYLFRVCNGDPQSTWRGKSSEFGFLFPSPVIVSLGNSKGNRKFRARITQMSFTHRMYHRGMVPMFTEMTIQVSRVSDLYTEPGADATTGANKVGVGVSGQNTPDTNVSPPATSTGGWTVPTTGYSLTDYFGTRGGKHMGIDMGAVNGAHRPAVAAREGTVMYVHDGCVAGDSSCGGGYGNQVQISHGVFSPHNAEVITTYNHLFDTTVTAGQKVKGGDTIGHVGTTGDSTGDHLHFEVKVGGSFVDPMGVFDIPASG